MTIEELYEHYQPDEQAIAILKSGTIVLLAGISGAGKDTLQTKLLENPQYHKIVTHTTRPPRANDGVMEQDGREYHFVSLDQMKQLLDNHQMIEINNYAGNYYGTSVEEFRAAHDANKIAIGNIDVNGIAAFRALAGDAVRPLFIVPPSYEEWQQRLASRYSSLAEFEEKFFGREKEAANELQRALGTPYYQFVINDDLDEAVAKVNELAHLSDGAATHDDDARLITQQLFERIKRAIS